LNLYDETWPIHTYRPAFPPAKTVFTTTEGPQRRVGEVLASMIGAGSIVSGGRVEHSLLSCNVRVNSWADVRDSVLFEGVQIGRHAKVRKAIIDKHVNIPEGACIGYDPAADLAAGYQISDEGVVVVANHASFSDRGQLDAAG
jgi:glucose-1-phosphate adenylyltransferase